MVNDLNQNDFKSFVLDSNVVSIVEFYADWCVPCKKIVPILEDIASSYNETVKVFKANYEESPDLVKKFNISSVPFILFFHNGMEVARRIGLVSKKNIEDCIKEIIYAKKT